MQIPAGPFEKVWQQYAAIVNKYNNMAVLHCSESRRQVDWKVKTNTTHDSQASAIGVEGMSLPLAHISKWVL